MPKKGYPYRDIASEGTRSDQGQGNEARGTQSEAQVKEQVEEMRYGLVFTFHSPSYHMSLSSV